MRKANRFIVAGNVSYLLCPAPNGAVFSVPINTSDLMDVVAAGFWRVAVFCHKTGRIYVYASHPKVHQKRIIYLHRFLSRPPDGLVVDHINHRSTDNRRCNLRNTTGRMNQLNWRANVRSSSGVRGVRRSSRTQKWLAYVDGKYLGRFTEVADARQCVEARLREIGVQQ